MSSLLQAKALLRQQIKHALKELTEQEKELQSKIILQKVLSSEIYKASQRISIFLPMKDEVNTLPILKSMFDAGKQCYIPHYEGGLDLIFMPGLAFSRNGARLGRGKGYYDKYLQQCLQAGTHPKTVALIFKEQLVNHIPTLEHDKFVDQVIFPTSEEINAIKT
ncbi:5-formyltetrahydrofolate cyclo-ligase-like isoform X3 [Physella acuta]|uniref:5-formyltetrahydrofolate cyclo-ligase-like isoform X3 n=1 Tax=Physella acuta TaxID=109671 RepID=UPI0027DACD33|nr:5-formyltetrahydrofolate cyclo-ligase-like isoform X3 [Physella acuta]